MTFNLCIIGMFLVVKVCNILLTRHQNSTSYTIIWGKLIESARQSFIYHIHVHIHI